MRVHLRIFYQKWPFHETNDLRSLFPELISNLTPEIGANKDGAADLVQVGAKSFLRRKPKLAPKVGRRH